MDQILYGNFFVEVFIFGSIALFTLIIGIRGILSKKPFLISSKWTFGLIVFCLLPQIYNSFNLSKLLGSDFEISQICWLAFILIFTYVLLMWREGYIAYGVTDASLREALQHVLKKMNIQFEVQVFVQGWMGVGQLKIKHRKDSKSFKEIVNGMNSYFQGSAAKANMVIFIFYIILGAFMTAIPVFSLNFIKHLPNVVNR